MDLGLAGKVVLVTGATTGIGKAIAIAFGREGARVVLTYRQKRDAALATAAAVEAVGGTARVQRLALDQPSEVAGVVAEIASEVDDVEVLVANAVRWPSAFFPIEDLPLEELSASLVANVVGQVALVKAVLPAMRRNHWGRIVMISTALAVEGGARTVAYSTPKGAIHSFTRTLAREVGEHGILANVLMAGAVDSEARPRPAWLREAFARSTMTGRMTEANEVARAAVFLGSAANGHIHGELIRCDGFIVNPARIEAPPSST